VINTETGKPLASALATAEPGGFGTRSNDDGVFELNQLPHGYYNVTVANKGFYSHRQDETLMVAGETTEHTYRLGPGAEVADNLVSNGGFERADEADPTPLGWAADGDEQRLSLDSETVYAGDRAQRLEAGDGPVGIIQWTGYTTITPGKQYRLQAWMRTSGVKAAAGKGARLAGTVVTNPHETLKELASKTVLTGDMDWTLMSIEFTAPPESGRVSLVVELDADAGTCWADEVAVVAID
jgi:hypothetical protein